MPTLRLNNATIRDYCEAQGWKVPAPGTTFVFAVRNARPVAGSTDTVALHEGGMTDRYDDCVGVGGTTWAMFPGTTDPGRPHTVRPMNREGAAWLVPGSYAYRAGHHKIPGNWALNQAEAVKVRRDRDRDGRPEYGEKAESGYFGINVHSGGFLAALVGPWSAGCLVMPREWFGHFRSILQSTGQTRFLVVLIDGRLLHKWLTERGR